ncbi:hypothetical protein MRB53_003961 [Persea americana]|uniref:Uncharacterized protein n=1 Tax=Persea americana TaxID=3435 RepID=A0ACC2MZR4_PERAE|nr:hypothetical protein MRB53_003961 [Persea americana]
MVTGVRSDHRPYGRDFDEGHVATGRFSNGKLITDFLVSKLGLKDLLPAYLDPIINDHDLLTGVSFASAGSGFDDRTAEISSVIPMDKQIEYFEQCKDRISASVGVEVAEKIVNDAIFVISAGTNDLVWNYYDLPTRKVDFTILGYHDFLLQKLQSLVEKIYSLGGRKFTIAGLAPIGCLPIQMTAADILPSSDMPRTCAHQQNDDAMAYNMKLQGLVIWMQGSLSGTKIGYVDIYNQIMDMVLSPTKYGLEETTRGCCGTGLAETGALCNSLSLTCPDASKYLFWDAIHPTQAVYQVLANKVLETVIPQLSD